MASQQGPGAPQQQQQMQQQQMQQQQMQQQQMRHQQQQQQQMRGMGNQGGNYGNRGRGRGKQDYSPVQQGRGSGPTSLAPTTGIPYGHVPAFLPGSSSLVEELDKRVMIVLRDGRHLVGILRSFDQFSNMVLEDASERKTHVHEGTFYYADIPLGVYIVRGESMVLLGQVATPDGMKQVEPDELSEMVKKHNGGTLVWDFDKDLLA